MYLTAVDAISLDYKESKTQSRLFYKPFEEGVFFLDLRFYRKRKHIGPNLPLFFVRFSNDIPTWKENRFVRKESILVRGIKKEFADLCVFKNEEHDWSYYSRRSSELLDFGGIEDGFCKMCGKDFQAAGFYCSEECRLKQIREGLQKVISCSEKCAACEKTIISLEHEYIDIITYLPELEDNIVRSSVINHHLNYEEDITEVVCASCHAKIHFRKTCKHKPVDIRPKEEQKYKLVPCSMCNGNARIKRGFDYTPYRIMCYKCRPKTDYPNSILPKIVPAYLPTEEETKDVRVSLNESLRSVNHEDMLAFVKRLRPLNTT